MQTALAGAPEAVLVVELAAALFVARVLVDVAEVELVGLFELGPGAEVDLNFPVGKRVAAVRVAGVVEERADLEEAPETAPEPN